MIKWNKIRFLVDKGAAYPATVAFLFGHLILINGWITTLIADFFQPLEHPGWFLKLVNSAEGKMILLYFGATLLSLSSILATILMPRIIREHRTLTQFLENHKDFFERNSSFDSFMKNEMEFPNTLTKSDKTKFRNLYSGLSNNLDEKTIENQKTKIMTKLYEYKDSSKGTPFIAAIPLLGSLIVGIYMSLAMLVRVSMASLQIILN